MQHLGTLPADASPLLREDYARRAGIAAGYREAAGITDPSTAISLTGHKSFPELETMRRDAIRAVEIADDEALIRAASHGELEARVTRGEQSQAVAPAPAHHLRAVTLVSILSGQRAELEAVQAEYDRWSTETAEVRESASQAKAELERRQTHKVCEPEVISEPEPEISEPEPGASLEADMDEPEAAELEL